MASDEISRRNLFPGLVAGAAALALPALLAAKDAEAADQTPHDLFSAVAGPVSLSASQTLTSAVFLLPAVQKVREAAARFRLSFHVLEADGSVRLLASPEFFLKAGGGTLHQIQVLADGSVFLGDAKIGELTPGGNSQIIAILIGLLLPAVQTGGVAATLQVANNVLRGENGGELPGKPHLLLPYIEQDNL